MHVATSNPLSSMNTPCSEFMHAVEYMKRMSSQHIMAIEHLSNCEREPTRAMTLRFFYMTSNKHNQLKMQYSGSNLLQLDGVLDQLDAVSLARVGSTTRQPSRGGDRCSATPCSATWAIVRRIDRLRLPYMFGTHRRRRGIHIHVLLR